MRLACALSFVLAAIALVPANAQPVWRPSAFVRTVDTYSEPLETRRWHDVSARSYAWNDVLASREDDLLVRFDEADSLIARDIYENELERREETDLLAREHDDYLYARSGNNKRPVSVSQEEPGEDGLYHWKLVIGAQGAPGTIWHDVIWSDKKHVGMVHRGPSAWNPHRAHGHIRMWHLADIDARSVGNLNHIAATTRTPKYTVQDIDKNCHTWIEDVIRKAVAARILPSNALSALARVPKH